MGVLIASFRIVMTSDLKPRTGFRRKLQDLYDGSTIGGRPGCNILSASTEPYTQYRISLNATTSAGFGQAAIEVSRTAEGGTYTTVCEYPN